MVVLESKNIAQAIFDSFNDKYSLTYAEFHKKPILRSFCSWCQQHDVLLVFPDIINENSHINKSWSYCSNCHINGKYTDVVKKTEPTLGTAMDRFINRSQLQFIKKFIDEDSYSMFDVIKKPKYCTKEFLFNLNLEPVTGLPQVEAFMGLNGFCYASDIKKIQQHLISNHRKSKHFFEDCPCIIFPFGHLPGRYQGFYAYTPYQIRKYYSRRYKYSKIKHPEYVYLRIGNGPVTFVENNWEDGLDLSALSEGMGSRCTIVLELPGT